MTTATVRNLPEEMRYVYGIGYQAVTRRCIAGRLRAKVHEVLERINRMPADEAREAFGKVLAGSILPTWVCRCNEVVAFQAGLLDAVEEARGIAAVLRDREYRAAQLRRDPITRTGDGELDRLIAEDEADYQCECYMARVERVAEGKEPIAADVVRTMYELEYRRPMPGGMAYAEALRRLVRHHGRGEVAMRAVDIMEARTARKGG